MSVGFSCGYGYGYHRVRIRVHLDVQNQPKTQIPNPKPNLKTLASTPLSISTNPTPDPRVGRRRQFAARLAPASSPPASQLSSSSPASSSPHAVSSRRRIRRPPHHRQSRLHVRWRIFGALGRASRGGIIAQDCQGLGFVCEFGCEGLSIGYSRCFGSISNNQYSKRIILETRRDAFCALALFLFQALQLSSLLLLLRRRRTFSNIAATKG